jgi:RHS repeat-associated protein
MYQYDAENRQISAGSSTYAYDGDGRRVSRMVASLQSVYAYDVFGNLAAEYGSTNSVSGTVYLTADHLGSTRLITSSANTLVNGTSPGTPGTAIECRDYLPFGEQILVGSGSPRLGLNCLTTEIGVRQQFTSKERDSESGLDYFEARYFSSTQGRFQSVDPANAGASRGSPQTWNAYAYVSNNPLNGTDPNGLNLIGSPANVNGAEEYRTFGGIFGNQSLATDLLLRETQERNEWIDEQLGQALAQQQNSSSITTTQGQSSDYVSVSYWPKGAGGFGHIGVGVDTDNTVGYSTVDPKVPWWKRIFGAPAGGTENDIAAHTNSGGEVAPHGYIHIPVTADQAAAMKGAIAARDPNTGNGGHYNLIFNNCAQFVESVLHAGGVSGVPHAEVFGPAILGGILWAEH